MKNSSCETHHLGWKNAMIQEELKRWCKSKVAAIETK